jgi:hypothetical protein
MKQFQKRLVIYFVNFKNSNNDLEDLSILRIALFTHIW